MLKKIAFLFFISFSSITLFAQETKLYNPDADAAKDIAQAVAKAKAEHKFVLIQGGGNWCKWCLEFARFAKADPQIDSVITNCYVIYHLNYSEENKNHDEYSKLGYPQRFGYPVFVILNGDGERIHTQNSEYLENGKGSYDKNKVQSFLEMWSPHALDPHVWGDK
ncbi:MAG: thioredoxin family protein [Ferruginibacter sp.]